MQSFWDQCCISTFQLFSTSSVMILLAFLSCFLVCFFFVKIASFQLKQIVCSWTKGVFTWHRGDFRPGASSLRFPLMALYLFTWYHHKMLCRRESPWFSHRGKNFTPVRNLATVSCKRETTTHFGVKSVCRYSPAKNVYACSGKNDTWSISGNVLGSEAKMPAKCCSDERSDGSFVWQWQHCNFLPL